jgi:glucose-1-phosphate adenylyltransferase
MEDECMKRLVSLDECLTDELEGITVVLAAEALYSMDFVELLDSHISSEADITIAACRNIHSGDASAFGIMDVDDDTGKVEYFIEKPTKTQLLEFIHCTTEELDGCVLDANMGVYVFNNSVLQEVLRDSKSSVKPGERHEFGKDVIPYAIAHGYDVRAFRHSQYWKPLRSLRDIYDANISIATGGEAAALLKHGHQVYTKPNFLPPSTFHGSTVTEKSIFADGCVIKDGSKIVDSVIGACTVIDKNVTLEGVVVVGRDEIMKRSGGVSTPDIGANTIIRRCIIDSDSIIGANVRILNEAGIQELDRTEEGYVISEGIVTILGGATIPDGFVI